LFDPELIYIVTQTQGGNTSDPGAIIIIAIILAMLAYASARRG